MFGPLAAWIVTHRPLVAAGLVLTLLGFGAGLKDLRADFAFTAFVGSDDPEYAYFLDSIDRWGRDDQNVLMVVETSQGSLLDPERLAAIERALHDVESLDEVQTAAGFSRMPWADDSIPGLIDTKPLHTAVPQAPNAIAAWQKRVLSDRSVVPAVLSEDGRRALLVARLSPTIDVDDILNIRPAVLAIRAALVPHQGDISFSLAGIPTVRADLVALIVSDTVTLAAAGALFILFTLLILFRSLHGVLVPVAATAVPLVMLLGLMGWTGEPIGLLSQAFATLIPAIAAADAIHVVSRFHEEIGVRLANDKAFTPGLRDEAIVAALERVGTACLFTSLTTAVGFGSLALADMRALQTFGAYAAVGIFFAFVTMVVVLPLLLGLVSRAPSSSTRAPGWVDGGLGWVARFAILHPRPILVAAALVVAGSIGFGTRVHVDNWLKDNLTPTHETQRANDTLDEDLAGTIPGRVDVTAAAGNLLDPDVLRRFDRVERWLAKRAPVRAVFGPATLLRRLNVLVTGKDELPESRALAEQLLLLAGSDDAMGIRVVTADRRNARIVFQLPDIGARGYRGFADAARPVVAEAFADPAIEAQVTGLSHVAYLAINRLVGELVGSLLAALLFIAFVLALLFRSIKICLVSLVPNCVPLAITLGAMGLFGWDLNPTSAVVFTVALGIAVDDTIHLLARVHGAPADWTTARALDAAVRSTGRALVVTTIVLLGGFGLVALSAFRINRWFGALSAIAIGSALVFDLLVLPALLSLTGRAGTRR